MTLLFILWRRLATVAVSSLSEARKPDDLVALLLLPLQLFDDIFTDIIFLSVEPFSALFVAMIVFFFFRDVVRDVGLGWMLWDWLRGNQYGIEEKGRTLLLRYHLTEQNLFSEMLAVIIVPLVVGCDAFFSYFNFGTDTISFGLDANEQLQVLLMYAVLLGVEIVNHVVVRLLLTRQVTKFRSQLASPRVSEEKQDEQRSSILEVGQAWNIQRHDKQYWARHFWYIIVMVVFAVTEVIRTTTKLKHEVTD